MHHLCSWSRKGEDNVFVLGDKTNRSLNVEAEPGTNRRKGDHGGVCCFTERKKWEEVNLPSPVKML